MLTVRSEIGPYRIWPGPQWTVVILMGRCCRGLGGPHLRGGRFFMGGSAQTS
jgi:hypothetical protein